MVNQLPVFYMFAFVNAINYPRFAFWSCLTYFGLRVFYTRAYFSFRGYNRATASEELLKLMLVIMMFGAISSSVRIMFPALRLIPKRF